MPSIRWGVVTEHRRDGSGGALATVKQYQGLSEAAQASDRESRFALAARNLEGFLAGPIGTALREMLKACREHIVLGKQLGGEYASVAILTSDGFYESQEGAGSWFVYAKHGEPVNPKLRPTPSRKGYWSGGTDATARRKGSTARQAQGLPRRTISTLESGNIPTFCRM